MHVERRISTRPGTAVPNQPECHWRALAWKGLAALFLLGMSAVPVAAEVVLGSTRVVYPATEREVALRMNNVGERPALVQVWIDEGDPASTPDDSDAPFLLTPPIVRIDPQGNQRIRIRHSGEAIAQDRESVFWINMLEVPPVASAEDRGNQLHVLVRSRIKLFYRPAGLAGRADEAAQAVRWSLSADPNGDGWTLHGENATPYHVSFSDLSLLHGDSVQPLPTPDMLAPHARLTLALPATSVGPAERVRYGVVNDYGGRSEFDAAIAH